MRYDSVVKEIYLDALRSDKMVTLTASGTSMLPFIKTGDVLTVRANGERIHRGDVVIVDSFEAHELKFVCHRIIRIERIGGRQGRIKGDIPGIRFQVIQVNDQPLRRLWKGWIEKGRR